MPLSNNLYLNSTIPIHLFCILAPEMNYLAHIYLSGNDRKVQIGNFIGDAVKGSSYTNYPDLIAKGVLMHRAIDDYTDNHPLIIETVRNLRPHFGRYSAVLLDIFFDHLLASRFDEFSSSSLNRFAWRFYLTILTHWRYLPERIKNFMWHFISTNRLGRYAEIEGIRESLNIMVKYNRLPVDVDDSIAFLMDSKEELWTVFHPFFVEQQTVFEDYVKKLNV